MRLNLMTFGKEARLGFSSELFVRDKKNGIDRPEFQFTYLVYRSQTIQSFSWLKPAANARGIGGA